MIFVSPFPFSRLFKLICIHMYSIFVSFIFFFKVNDQR